MFVEVPGAVAPPGHSSRSPPSQPHTKDKTPQACGASSFVEVPGIEPGSNGVYQILLRAQSCCGAFSLAGLYDPSANTAYPLLNVPHTPSSKGAW